MDEDFFERQRADLTWGCADPSLGPREPWEMVPVQRRGGPVCDAELVVLEVGPPGIPQRHGRGFSVQQSLIKGLGEDRGHLVPHGPLGQYQARSIGTLALADLLTVI